MSKIYDELIDYLIENYQFLVWHKEDVDTKEDGTEIYTYRYEGNTFDMSISGDEFSCDSLQFRTKRGTPITYILPLEDTRIQKLFDLLYNDTIQEGIPDDRFWKNALEHIKGEAEFIKDKI